MEWVLLLVVVGIAVLWATRNSPRMAQEQAGCLVLTVILVFLAYSWFNSWLNEQKRKSDARKREFQNGVKKWLRLFKGGG